MKKPQPDANRILYLRIPLHAQRVLHVDCGHGLLGAMVKTREGSIEVYGVEGDPAAATDARARLDRVLEEYVETAQLPVPNAYFDCIVLSDPARHGEALGGVLEKLAPLLAPNGLLLMPIAEQDGDPLPTSPRRINTVLAQAGLALYMIWPWAELGATSAGPVGSVEPCPEGVCHAVWPSYDPASHAHELFDAGRPDWAYEILCGIPGHYRTKAEVDAGVQAERQLCLLAMDEPGGQYPQLRLFCGSLTLFYRVVELAPTLHQAYQCQAEFWHRIGDDDMAARLLRSLQRAAPADFVAQQLGRYVAPSPRREETAPLLTGKWTPRILMLLTHDRTHYGLDVLYDGLRRILGEDHVVEYPWKPTLHGHVPDRLAYYPSLFDWPGEAVPLEELLQQLDEGRFDLVLFANIEMSLDRDEVRRIVQAAGDRPLFVLDAQDDCVNSLPEVIEFVGRATVQGYFKRELLACADFGPNTFPFPFAYADDHVLDDISRPRPRAMFWAGQRTFGLRRLYLERMEAIMGERFEKTYGQDEYIKVLRASRMGVSITGAGFDCVRYWELPANGCMLLSERFPRWRNGSVLRRSRAIRGEASVLPRPS